METTLVVMLLRVVSFPELQVVTSDFGPSSFEFQRLRFETKFSCFGPEFSTSSVPFYPTYEQMARHWFFFFANPSVGPFAHPFDR